MKNLMAQIAKFGIVGVICFFIDYLIGLAVMNIIVLIFGQEAFQTASVVGSVIGFAVSVVANYILSFKFVFERKEDLNRKAEFVIFLVLSIIGMGINSLLMWLGVGPVYNAIPFLKENVGNNLMYSGSKVFATGVVMVYNFITRKIFLEKKD